MSRSITFGAVGNVDLRRLRYFVAVAEERHFGRAAARLHMSTPPLSQRIREFERDLGVSLFTRSSRRVELTRDGERLLAEARAVLHAAERFEQTATRLSASPTEVMLGFCHGSEGGAMRAMRRFRDQHPGVTVHPAAMTSVAIHDALRAGRMAVGIVRGPVTEPDLVVSVPLARVPVDHVVLPPDHRLAAQPSIDLRDLDGEAVLVVDRGDAPHAHDDITSHCAALGVRPRWVFHGATQIERVFDMAAVGTGIGWLNTWQAERETGRSDVAIRPLTGSSLADDFRVAWRAGDTDSAAAAFVRVILETAGG